MNLYELTNEQLALERKLQDAGYDEEVIADTLDANSADFEQKICDYVFVLKNFQANISPREAEIDRLSELNSKDLKTIARIEKTIKDAMVATSKTEVKHGLFTVKTQVNQPKLFIDNAEAVPSEFYIQPPLPPKVIDNAALKAKLVAGEVIEGARIERGISLRIK